MHPEKFVPQVNFCRWFLQRHCVDEPVFPWRILFTYEAKPTREDVINFHNSHVWDDENPYATRPHGFQQHYGFWMNVLLGHNFFHLISRWCVLEIPWPHTARALGRCATACVSKHVVSARWCTTSFCCSSFSSSGLKIWANMDRLWWPNCLPCTFTRSASARLLPIGPHEELGLQDPCGFREGSAGTGYVYGEYWTTSYCSSCVPEHDT